MAQCWPLRMPPTPKSVLISLADNANDHGDCWPSLSTICERTCFGKTAVIEAIRWLEERNALSADRSNGRHTKYVLTPSEFRPNLSASRTGASPEPVRLADGTCPAGEPDLSASRTGPVRQADTNRKEPSRTKIKSNRQHAQSGMELPDWLPADAWREYVAHRKAIRKPMGTDYARKLAIGKLGKLRADGHDPKAVIDQSIGNGWQGLFAIIDETDGRSRAGKHAASGALFDGPSPAAMRRLK